uniref:Uncharacterized protein n=1 Tax=Vespula pensylvanica TaxID=30213 RepID=A0A834KPV0_VESPE|nr:hypothetical protein H0235_013224 [Vespula pensylvanica]
MKYKDTAPGYGNPMQMTELSEVSDEGSAHFIGTFRGQLRAEACGRKGNGTVHAALRYVVLLLWLNGAGNAGHKVVLLRKRERRTENEIDGKKGKRKSAGQTGAGNDAKETSAVIIHKNIKDVRYERVSVFLPSYPTTLQVSKCQTRYITHVVSRVQVST